MTDIVERLRNRSDSEPDAINAILFAQAADEIERLRADRELLAQMMIRQSMSTGHGDTVADLVRELEPQVERLRAEAASWEKQAEERTKDAVQFIEERDRLRAEVEALRADAERYRWLRDDAMRCDWMYDEDGSLLWADELDKAIDAARREQ